MKQLIKVIFAVALLLSFGRCAMEFPPIVVLPDTTLNESGLVRFNTIDTYETDIYTVVVARTEGVSKPVDFDIVIDESLLTAYNELNGSDYTMMPAGLYTMGATELSLEKSMKTAEFPITFKPAAALAQAGSAAAVGKYVVPFVCIPKSEINAPESRLNALVTMSVDGAVVSVQASASPEELAFISGVEIPAELELASSLNFRDPDLTSFSTQTTQQMVDDYNTAKGTSRLLLPANVYSIDDAVYDEESGRIVYDITISGWSLDAANTYLLPVKVVSTKYPVVQTNVYYVEISVQDIKYTIVNHDSRYEAATKLSHRTTVEVTLNGALLEGVPIEFSYDPALIADYNDAKGKEYKTLDASRVTITNATMAAATLSASVSVAVDMTDIAFDNGDAYVLPLKIDMTKLPAGAQMTGGNDVTYIRLKRTLYGEWANANTNDPAYLRGGDGWTSDNYMRRTTIFSNDANYQVNASYIYCNCYYSWARGYYWYVDWNTNHNGDPTKRVIKAYSSVTSGISKEDMEAWTMPVESWFDMVEGKVWFNYQYYYNQDDKDIDKRQTIKIFCESPLTPEEF